MNVNACYKSNCRNLAFWQCQVCGKRSCLQHLVFVKEDENKVLICCEDCAKTKKGVGKDAEKRQLPIH
jgi:hypothetical protein